MESASRSPLSARLSALSANILNAHNQLQSIGAISTTFDQWSPSDDNDEDSTDHGNLEIGTSSSASPVESSRYDVSNLETYMYYFGIRGPSHCGPKLIFRTSKDVFTPPSGPDQYPRLMCLRPVYEHHILGKDNGWEKIRSKVVEILDKHNVKLSSVDLARFSWIEDVEENEDDEDHEDVDAPYGKVVTNPHHDLDLDPLKTVIDPVTTALGLPIASLRRLSRRGTLGFYFQVDKDIYGVTARHVLFPDDEGNNEYSYVFSAPKKEVVLMGTKDYKKLLLSIQGRINTLNNTLDVLQIQDAVLTERSEGGGPNAAQAARELDETRRELIKTQSAINDVNDFFVKMNRHWRNPKNRVIGHVTWARPISIDTHTMDICVIKLDKEKFAQNFRGNVLDLGPEIDATRFIELMYPRVDAPSDFRYPAERILNLRGILSAKEMRRPNNKGQSALYLTPPYINASSISDLLLYPWSVGKALAIRISAEQEYYTVLLLLDLATGEKKRRLLTELHELAQTIEQADEILSDSLEDYRSETILLETLDPELENDGA
ncbi:hypothetical protein BGW80DRAFT_1566799 [Lactifluus volemus]|nr:hypothetical protein BGW80DRAFT_1566799 [Lactifluus volemus]